MEAATVSESAVVVGADIQLGVDNIFTYYGAAPALKGISLNVGNGQIVAVLGSNGAGKTTLLKTINGMIAPRWAASSSMGRISRAYTRT